jgi:hypothetical protein
MDRPRHATAAAPGPACDLNPIERQVLMSLDPTAPSAITRLPVRWPLIRMHLPVVLERLDVAGLIRLAPSTTDGGAVVLTDRGREAHAACGPAGMSDPQARISDDSRRTRSTIASKRGSPRS